MSMLKELGICHTPTPCLWCDNLGATYLSANPIFHARTKHIEIDLHFFYDRVALSEARVLHVPSSLQFVDLFTKGLPSQVFTEFRSSLNVLPNGVPAERGVNMYL